MVMTSQMYHILFEKPRENEYIIIMNTLATNKRSRKGKPLRKGNEVTVVNETKVCNIR